MAAGSLVDRQAVLTNLLVVAILLGVLIASQLWRDEQAAPKKPWQEWVHMRDGTGVSLAVLATMPFGHWKVTTLVAGLRTGGITAPCVFDGAINGERFRAYVEQMLAPTLRPDDIVLMDRPLTLFVTVRRQSF
jgi:hypothetical protein